MTHFDSCAWHENVTCSHFQQFLYWEMPGFIFAPQIIAMWFPMLKHLLMSPFALLLLWTSQISNYIITISNLGNTLIILSFKTTVILLKMWLFLIIVSTTSAEIGVLVFSKRYGISIIFKYDFDCGNWGVSTLSESIWLVFFIYLLIVCKSRDEATLMLC